MLGLLSPQDLCICHESALESTLLGYLPAQSSTTFSSLRKSYLPSEGCSGHLFTVENTLLYHLSFLSSFLHGYHYQ
jgi:hypothetical protein